MLEQSWINSPGPQMQLLCPEGLEQTTPWRRRHPEERGEDKSDLKEKVQTLQSMHSEKFLSRTLGEISKNCVP